MVLGVGVCMDTGDLVFFRNDEKLIEWTGVLRESVSPYTAMQHVGPGSTLVQPSALLCAWQQQQSRHSAGLAGRGQVTRNALTLHCCAKDC